MQYCLRLVLTAFESHRTDEEFNPYIATEFLHKATADEIATLAAAYPSDPAAVNSTLILTSRIVKLMCFSSF